MPRCGLLQQCGSQIVSCSALLAPNQELAFVVSVAANIFSFITCGFLVRTSNLVACVRSLRFLSPVKLGFQALALNELAEREFSASLQLEDLRGALREVGAGAAWDGAGSQLGAAPWWLRQRSLRDAATRVLEEVLPCADPCVTGMVSSGREALECIGLDEPAAVWPAVLGLLAHSAALHALAWLCLSKLSRERR
ncbi:unnamed protein product [Prorocentrum cordatum]|uniref:Uncharacterized protein n=1 Tax=Prorocentrum cordatum TaxID=2364126 RepID=A0ABN9XTV0_9DINO|nr:unnamed protein product [Polarella glacialis]